MKKKFISVFVFSVSLITVFLAFSGCGDKDVAADGPVLSVANGNFTGVENDGVLEFKGIPYAKAPVRDLRWKAPEAPDDSDETFDAAEYGKTSVQYSWHSEPAGENEIGEDCLTLNVWTADLKTKDKPILFYIHGGGFAWGGTADPLYDGQFIVREHPDTVIITSNYRVGMMGSIDFSHVEGGEDFPDSSYLSILDLMQSLKWVQDNAESFGGDPGNVTIYGESAGGAFVSLLMSCKNAEGLFRHAIAESGSVNLTYSQEDFDDWGLTEALLAKTGAKNMDDLMAIPEKDLIRLYTEYDKEGNCLNDLYNMPRRGGSSPVPEDPYPAIADGVNKDVDFMTGTNSDEWRYWVDEMGEVATVGRGDKKAVKKNLDIYKKLVAKEKYDTAMSVANAKEKANIKKLMEICDEDEEIWQWTEVGNETGFRIPSIVCAYNHAKAGGNSYMYYFEKKSDLEDWLGACHASECAYVFHNLTGAGFSGTMDEELADHVCAAWVNFAAHGDPSTDFAKWGKYGTDNRNTMIIGDDGSMTVENDPLGEQRKLIEPFAYYYLK